MRMLPYFPTYTKSRALVLRFNLALWALLEAVSVSTRRGQLPAQGQTPGRHLPFPSTTRPGGRAVQQPTYTSPSGSNLNERS